MTASYKPKLVSIFIPTYQGADDLRRTLPALFTQKADFPFEVVCIDSSSTDGTWELLAGYPIRRHRIASRDFNHGGTRNHGVSLCEGEIVVLLTQDAVPANEFWLTNLIANYADPMVAGAYSRQIPRSDGTLLPKIDAQLMLTGRSEKVVQRLADHPGYFQSPPDQRRALCNFDDICASMRKSVWNALPYQTINFAEDLDWGRRAFEAGYTVVYDPTSMVIHSHDRSFTYEFKRAFVTYRVLDTMFGRGDDGFRLSHALRTIIHAGRNLAGVYPGFAETPLAERLQARYIVAARALGHAGFNFWHAKLNGTPTGERVAAWLGRGI